MNLKKKVIFHSVADTIKPADLIKFGQCDSVNILKLLNYFRNHRKVCLIYEDTSTRTLGQLLNSQELLEENQAVSYLIQLINAIQTFHKNGITVDQIILHNIFMNNDILKMGNNQTLFHDMVKMKNINNDQENDSLNTMAPELLVPSNQATDPADRIKCDIWCLGIIYYRMIFGSYPFQSYCREKLHELIMSQEIIDLSDTQISDESKELIDVILNQGRDVSKRVSWEQLLQLPLLQKYQTNTLLQPLNNLQQVVKLPSGVGEFYHNFKKLSGV